MTNNPYEAPQAKVIEENPHSPPRRNYGGIKRLSYLGIMITLVILQAIIAAGSDRADPSGDNGLLAALFFMGILIFPAYYRLKNIGMNPWWCILMIIPIVNLLVGIRCLVLQEGYQDARKLDTSGRVVTYIVLAFVILIVIGSVLTILDS